VGIATTWRTAQPIVEESPNAIADGASNSVAMNQWGTVQACAALDALKQWHEEVAQQFRKYKVDEEKLKSMADSDAVARELRVPRAAVAAIAEYIKPLVATRPRTRRSAWKRRRQVSCHPSACFLDDEWAAF
jgi:hypothetical protein